MARMTYELFGVLQRNPTLLAVEVFPKLVQNALMPGVKHKSENTASSLARKSLLERMVGPALPDTYGLSVSFDNSVALSLANDPMGDKLDALFACIQTAWAYQHPNKNYGIPLEIDVLEGWIVDPATVKAFVERSSPAKKSRATSHKISNALD